MRQIDLDKLVSEQALNDWYKIIRIKTELTVLRSATSADGGSASVAILEARRNLVEQYQEIRKRQSAYERPQVRMGPSAFGPSGCGASLLRPKDIDRWRRVNPDDPGTHGTIRQTAVEHEYGVVEFDADLTKSGASGPNDYSTWMLQWVYLYVFPAPIIKSRLHYTFRLWPNTWWFTETDNRRVVIMLHVGIEHVSSLGSVGGPLHDELWPVIIDTDRPELLSLWVPIRIPDRYFWQLRRRSRQDACARSLSGRLRQCTEGPCGTSAWPFLGWATSFQPIRRTRIVGAGLATAWSRKTWWSRRANWPLTASRQPPCPRAIRTVPRGRDGGSRITHLPQPGRSKA